MAYWGKNGLLQPSSLLDAALQRRSIQPICRCGHSVIFHPHGLWWHFQRRGWDDRIVTVRQRFWCIMCRSRDRKKVRPQRLEFMNLDDANIVLPLPDELLWKQIQRRVR